MPVVVLCKNQFYYFSALWPETDFVAVDETDIYDILHAIQHHANQTDPRIASREGLGVLTALPRSDWARARRELENNEINRHALHVIDSALFILVLDDFAPPNHSMAAANMLHGTNQVADGDETFQEGTCLNRWYDKLQLIICEDGTAGVNFEHAAIDGHTALRFVSDVFAETVITFAESITQLIYGAGKVPHVIEATVERAAMILDGKEKPKLDVFPKKLVFELSEADHKRIFYAENAVCDQIVVCDSCMLEFKDFGKILIVGNNFSPDSFVQMSILLAYYKLYGKLVSAYEPVLTKSFYHGRTEAMRPATPAAKELCEIWCDGASTSEEKIAALRQATKEHSRLVAEAARGKGVDRHLFALKCIAKKNNLSIPALFESDAWKQLNHTVISTSNCGNPSLLAFGFGPVVYDGFGIGYIIKDSALSYSIASKHRQTSRYVRTLCSVLREMHSLMKPLSAMHVSHRPSLKEVMISHDHGTYDDMFGENELVNAHLLPHQNPRIPNETSSTVMARQEESLPGALPEISNANQGKKRGRYFSWVREFHSSRIDLLDTPTTIDIDLEGLEIDEGSNTADNKHPS